MAPLIEQDLSHLTDDELNHQVHGFVSGLIRAEDDQPRAPGPSDEVPNYCSDRTLTRDMVESAIATGYQDDFGLVLNRTDLTGRRYLVLHEKRTLRPLNRVPIGSSGENRAFTELALLRLLSLAEFRAGR